MSIIFSYAYHRTHCDDHLEINLARPKLEGNVVDFAAHKTNPKMNELAPETKSLDKLVRYGNLAQEKEMGLVDVFKEYDPDYRTAIQRQPQVLVNFIKCFTRKCLRLCRFPTEAIVIMARAGYMLRSVGVG